MDHHIDDPARIDPAAPNPGGGVLNADCADNALAIDSDPDGRVSRSLASPRRITKLPQETFGMLEGCARTIGFANVIPSLTE
jgi:hypothetical protein